MVVTGEKRFEYLMPTIVLDNLNGGKQATDYLIQKGHRRIGFITGREDMSDSADREEGYRLALKEAGIPVEESLILKGDYTIPSGVSAAGKFIEMSHPPTAIFAANDAMAIGVLKTIQNCKKEGLFAIVGFDDIEMSSFVTPTLTTVGYDLHELGKQAVHKLMRLVHGRGKDPVHPGDQDPFDRQGSGVVFGGRKRTSRIEQSVMKEIGNSWRMGQ